MHQKQNTLRLLLNTRIQVSQILHPLLQSYIQLATACKIRSNVESTTKLSNQPRNSNSLPEQFFRSLLVYSCQNWNLNPKQMDRLDVVYRTFLRKTVLLDWL